MKGVVALRPKIAGPAVVKFWQTTLLTIVDRVFKYNIMYYMRKVTTRELLHHTKRIQSALARGESFTWTSRGRIVGYLSPPKVNSPRSKRPDFVKRALEMGAATENGVSIVDQLLKDRD